MKPRPENEITNFVSLKNFDKIIVNKFALGEAL